MDIADRAQELEEGERHAALLRHRNRLQPKAIKAGERRLCRDCGKPIPAKRIKAHPAATRCIEDARAQEARAKHYAGSGAR